MGTSSQSWREQCLQCTEKRRGRTAGGRRPSSKTFYLCREESAMPAHRIVDGVYIHLATPAGFRDAAAIYPSFLEIYRREQDVLAVYLEDCQAGSECRRELPDPFVEVLVPEKASPLRSMEQNFFEACKLEVEGSIRGRGVRPARPRLSRGIPCRLWRPLRDGRAGFRAALCAIRKNARPSGCGRRCEKRTAKRPRSNPAPGATRSSARRWCPV